MHPYRRNLASPGDLGVALGAMVLIIGMWALASFPARHSCRRALDGMT
jgi:hypothetical protein